jgi:hypothetical protein
MELGSKGVTTQTHKRLPSEPTQEMIEAMELAASRMVNAQVACMDGLGGSKTYDELDDETKQYVGRDYPATVGMYRAMWKAAPDVEPLDDETILGIARTIPNLSGDDSALIQFARELGV